MLVSSSWSVGRRHGSWLNGERALAYRFLWATTGRGGGAGDFCGRKGRDGLRRGDPLAGLGCDLFTYQGGHVYHSDG